jgi:hypothetical protein
MTVNSAGIEHSLRSFGLTQFILQLRRLLSVRARFYCDRLVLRRSCRNKFRQTDRLQQTGGNSSCDRRISIKQPIYVALIVPRLAYQTGDQMLAKGRR